MFRTRLVVQSDMAGRWVLMSALAYVTRRGYRIVVPAGYTTDFFSIPRVLRWLYDTDGRSCEAAVTHDYLYTDLTHVFTKAEADRIFYEALADLDQRDARLPQPPAGRGWWARFKRGSITAGRAARRWTMWAGVRIGGRGDW